MDAATCEFGHKQAFSFQFAYSFTAQNAHLAFFFLRLFSSFIGFRISVVSPRAVGNFIAFLLLFRNILFLSVCCKDGDCTVHLEDGGLVPKQGFTLRGWSIVIDYFTL